MFNPSSFFQTPFKQPKQMQLPIGNIVWEEPCDTSQTWKMTCQRCLLWELVISSQRWIFFGMFMHEYKLKIKYLFLNVISFTWIAFQGCNYYYFPNHTFDWHDSDISKAEDQLLNISTYFFPNRKSQNYYIKHYNGKAFSMQYLCETTKETISLMSNFW